MQSETAPSRTSEHAQPAGYTGQAVAGDFRHDDRILPLVRILLGFGCFFLSWHVIKFGSINLSLSDIAFIACLGLLALRGQLNTQPFGALTITWLLGLVLFLGGMLLGSIVNGDPLRWLIVAGQYIFAYLLLPMVLLSRDRKALRGYLLLYAAGVAASQVIALSASFFVTFDDTGDVLGWDFISPTGRIGAFSGNANWNGACIGFALPILLNAFQHRRIGWPSALAMAVPLVWGLLATASVTGLLATTVAMIVYLVAGNPAALLRIGLPIVLVVGLYVGSGQPLPAQFEQRVAGAFQSGRLADAGTFEGRAELAKEAWRMADDTMLVGLGADQFRKASAYGAPVHVFPLLVLTEGGIWALIGLVTMVAVLAGSAVRILPIDRSDAQMALAVLTVLTIVMFALPHMYSRLWVGPIFLALGVGLAKRPGRRPVPNPAQLSLRLPRSPAIPARRRRRMV